MNLNRSVYSTGALVRVAPEERPNRRNSEGGLAFVRSYDEETLTVDVDYTLGGNSQEVLPHRLSVASLDTTA